jgi:hypothetical protein
MNQPTESILAILRTYKGKRVRLHHTSDAFTRLVPGDEGVVTFVDDCGTVHVAWDNGSTLGLIYREDSYEVVA